MSLLLQFLFHQRHVLLQLRQQLGINRKTVQLDLALLLGLVHGRQQGLLQPIIQRKGGQYIPVADGLSDNLALECTTHIGGQQNRILGQLTRIQQGSGNGADISQADLLLKQLTKNSQLLHLGQRQIQFFRQPRRLGSQVLAELADLVMTEQPIQLLLSSLLA